HTPFQRPAINDPFDLVLPSALPGGVFLSINLDAQRRIFRVGIAQSAITGTDPCLQLQPYRVVVVLSSHVLSVFYPTEQSGLVAFLQQPEPNIFAPHVVHAQQGGNQAAPAVQKAPPQQIATNKPPAGIEKKVVQPGSPA